MRIIQAPDYEKNELLRSQKVINEPNFLPLHFIRILAQAAKLLRTYRGKLLPTPLGRRMLTTEQHGPLQALLFHVAFWRLNLAYFDGYPLDYWPQSEVGVILWSLSTSAHDWLSKIHSRLDDLEHLLGHGAGQVARRSQLQSSDLENGRPTGNFEISSAL